MFCVGRDTRHAGSQAGCIVSVAVGCLPRQQSCRDDSKYFPGLLVTLFSGV